MSDNEIPMIFVGKKKNIGRDYSKKFDRISNNLEQYSIKDIIMLFELGDNIHDKRLSDINPESLSYFLLPNIHKMYHLTSFDKSFSKQYIIHKNKKYYPDIIVSKSPLNNIGVIIDNESDNVIKINDKLIVVPQDIKENIIELNEYCKIDINILVAESGSPITEKGQKYIDAMRKKFSLDTIIKYNEELIEKCMEYWNKNSNNLDENQTMLFTYFLINQLLVKTISMKKYNKYYADIDEALNRMIYFSIDKGNKLNRIVKQKIIDKEFIEEMIAIIKEVIRLEYKPYHDLMHIFYDVEPK